MALDHAQQLDLFGDVEREIDNSERRRRERVLWASLFERADWVAPYDCADGTAKGTAILGWRCPDPACQQIEPNGFLLAINHGFDPHVPDPWAAQRGCTRVRLFGSSSPGKTSPWPGLPWPPAVQENS
ncbi:MULTISPECIES: hypothetical protein [Mycobacterium avium complex (MAC)]|uniref:Uncharacterized protein n=1 Tax=Mycobacterium intracellulare subsp. chimaera TaxID=222805 RepID=A0ABT7P6X6_MYCIT|nr:MULTISPECIES: hypothetical protein [Mycobacterium avium complex (MAC)]AOS94910.1 hypothetical protein AN480_27970 [Mycobacterium intracellulare subsp. chimaera]MDM3928743.1 hypothetical protein [Mycobacterium intracellulare subsp. chimaera]